MPQPPRVVKLCRWEDDLGPHTCDNWDDCAGKPWYPAADILYCRYQVLWIIAEFLERDNLTGDYRAARLTWPGEEKDTGYIEGDLNVQKSPSSRVPYQNLLEVVQVVEERLKRCGRDGKDLYNEVKNPANDQDGATFTDYRKLSPEARAACGYCSGRRPKTMPYSQWKRQKRWREKPAMERR